MQNELLLQHGKQMTTLTMCYIRGHFVVTGPDTLRDRGQAFEAAGVEFIDANNGGAGLRRAS
jgi:hypothetical protein